MAFDADAGSLTFYKNGVSQGVNSTGLTGEYFPYAPTWNYNAAYNFGQRPFAHPVSNYLPLSTTNLPTPTIADGSDYFDAKLWTGNGSTQSITGLEFSPDFVWIKSRNFATDHALFDAVRGATKRLRSNQTNAENTDANTLTAFNSDGFSLGSSSAVNNNTKTFVGWAWDAGANSGKTYTVKVVSDSGNKYRFDDFGTSAVTLDLEEGSTYVFDQSDSSNSGHPLRFSTTSDGTHNSGTEYTTGVTTTGTPGSAGAKTTIVVAASAPTLYYYCSAHSGMGGQANTNSTAGASNFDGTIQSTVRASQEAGFSIIKYDGSGSAGTIGHGLNAQPHMVIVKNRSTAGYNWKVLHKGLTGFGTYMLSLDATGAETAASASWFNSTAPTSSVISLGTLLAVNGNNEDYICYAFAPVAGYSAFGKYTSNNLADGPFVNTGFKPRWIMFKNATSAWGWYIHDTERSPDNSATEHLIANATNAEETTAIVDILSNGFKLTAISEQWNKNTDEIIYIAFAENPFQANGGLAR